MTVFDGLFGADRRKKRRRINLSAVFDVLRTV